MKTLTTTKCSFRKSDAKISLDQSSLPPVYTVMQDIRHLLNRIGYGPRPGDVERVERAGRDRYIEQQLQPARLDDRALEARLASIPSITMTTTQILENYPNPRRFVRQLGLRPNGDLNGNNPALRRQVLHHYQEKGLNLPQKLLEELQAQKIIRAVHSERQLQEVMTDFWLTTSTCSGARMRIVG